MPKVLWEIEPEDHDYPAAQSYLSLLTDPDEIARIVAELRSTTIELFPILLIRGNGGKHLPLTIADGYHRACAVYWNSEDDFIHARIASWSSL
jgi:hypothetical protein